MSDLMKKSKANHDEWHDRWEKNHIGFHEEKGNHLLKQHFDVLSVESGQHVFLPLCGKTRDIGWLLSKDLKVSGIELNESAIIQLFEELEITPTVQKIENLTTYSATNLQIYVGDFFELTKTQLGPVDAVFDRAALVALPEELRHEYARHLRRITATSRQLLVCYDYDQSLFGGPPFSVTENEVQEHYASKFNIQKLYRKKVEGGFRGQKDIYEAAYLLT